MNSIGIKLRWYTDSDLVVYKRKKAQVWMSFKKTYQVLNEYVALLPSLNGTEDSVFPYQELYQWTYVPIFIHHSSSWWFSELSEFTKVAKCACVKLGGAAGHMHALCFERHSVRDLVLATGSAEGELGCQQVRAKIPAFFYVRLTGMFNYRILYVWF